MIKDGIFLFFVATHENDKSIVIVWISYVADVTSSSGFKTLKNMQFPSYLAIFVVI